MRIERLGTGRHALRGLVCTGTAFYGWEQPLCILCSLEFLTPCCCILVRYTDRVCRLIRTAESGTTSSRCVDGHLSQSKHQSTHKLRSSCSSHSLVGPIRFMSDLNFQLKFVHLCKPRYLHIHVWLEIPGVIFVIDERLHLVLEKLNVLKRCVETDINR